MKNIELIVPKLEEYYYEQKLEENPNTMSYNKGYNVSYDGYHYDTGCIDFPKDKWKASYEKRIKENKFFAYIKDNEINEYVGYVNYQYNRIDDRYECGILIEYKYRGEGYSKDALILLIKEAYKNNIHYLYDTFELDRGNTLNLFKSVGFEVVEETTWKKFNKNVKGVIVRVNTSIYDIHQQMNNIKNDIDILNFLKINIRYGWKDKNNSIHIGNMKNFRKEYEVMSLDETLKYGVGTCIEQVNLIKRLLDNLNIKSRMFCTRIYEPDNFDEADKEEHMHSFILYYKNNKVYHLEHANYNNIGIFEYSNLDDAIKNINEYYINLSNGIFRNITEFYEVKSGLSFREFNNYINSLDITFRKLISNNEDIEKIYKWCSNKYVYEWFEQRKLSYEEIREKYLKKLRDKKQDLYIIKSNGVYIGLVQIYKYENDIKFDKLDNYKNIYEYDIFIGEEKYLSKGIGTKIINLVNDNIYKKYKADLILLRPFRKNKRAINCYIKCDFKEIYSYIDFDTIGNKEEYVVFVNERNSK